ncbi:MAG: carboxylesterase/lipase family protein, partial [Promethearchaeota archaeon]
MKRTEIIETKTGKLQGYIDRGLSIFKGIPYAEPPIGELRLNNPILKKPWDGIFEALKFGPEVPQPIGPDTPLPRPIQNEEECLTLNIWTPATDGEKRPVMMWIHGGAFIYGSNSRALYNGFNLSKRGNIVVVSINYRLGPFANLALPGAKANVGMLDQITALEWIRVNIDYFGGDPNNVTIFGESAGGVSVCTLMAMPKAKGLFKRAIAESNGPHPLGYRKSILEQSTEILLDELNFKSNELEEFQKIPWEDILKATERFNRRVASEGIRLISGFAPFVDGDTIPTHPLKAIQDGYAKDIELIIGCNFEEAKFNHLNYRDFKETKPENLSNRMLRLLRNT